MQIAIGIGSNGLITGGEGEGELGLLTGAEAFALAALFGLQIYPLDVVGIGHGVFGGADVHVDEPAVHSIDAKNGDMLFLGGVGGVGDELLHGFTAAGGDLAAVVDEADDVAAMFADEEFGGAGLAGAGDVGVDFSHGVHSFREDEGKGLIWFDMVKAAGGGLFSCRMENELIV